MTSWMAKFNPLGMIFTCFLIIFMDRGASQISTTFGLNQSFADIITGILLFFIIGCEFFINYRIHFRTKSEKAVAAGNAAPINTQSESAPGADADEDAHGKDGDR